MLARTRQITVEAVQWRGDNEAELIAFFPEGGVRAVPSNDMLSVYPRKRGVFDLLPNEWLVRFPEGRVVDMGAEEFAQRFEVIEPPEENEGSD